MKGRKAIMLGVAVLIGSAGLASSASAAVISPSTNNPYHIEVDGGGATPAAAEANAVSKVPSNCSKPWIIDGPYVNDGEWVVVEEAICTPDE